MNTYLYVISIVAMQEAERITPLAGLFHLQVDLGTSGHRCALDVPPEPPH